jgi:hypothetical protein
MTARASSRCPEPVEGQRSTARGERDDRSHGSSRVRVLLVLAALLVAPAAAGTILVKLDLADLVARSQLVLEGTVIERVAYWRDDRILTDSTLSVDAVLAADGPVAPTITITTPGGELDDVGLWVPGASRFVVAERYMVFARRVKAGWRVTGMAQGCLRIVTDDEGMDWVLPPAVAGLVSWQDGLLVTASPFMTEPRPLEDVEAAILELAKESP